MFEGGEEIAGTCLFFCFLFTGRSAMLPSALCVLFSSFLAMQARSAVLYI